MQRSEQFDGGAAPFEGERTIIVRSIPEGAQLSSAVLTLTPVAAPGAPLFEESITFTGATGTLGATQSRNDATSVHWSEIDFHQRRTVTRFAGSGLFQAEVQVDLGGLYVQLNDVGAPKAPGDPVLKLGADGAVPGLAAPKFKLTHNAAVAVSQVTLRSAPSNVVIRSGAEPAFFSRAGELVSPVTTPDLSTALQAALAKADVAGGFYQLPITIHSDTLCRLDVELTVEFTVAAPALPGGLTETTLTYDFSGAPPTPAMTLAVPAGSHVVPTAARARALGAFQASRVGYGPIGPVAPAAALTLTANQSLAVPITVPADLDVTAVDLLLAATTPTARLQLDVVADTDGKPWNQPLLPRPVEVGIDKGDDDAQHWTSAALPATFTFTAETRYWLTLQVESGEATWSVVAATASPAIQQSHDGGLSWRAASAPGVASADALLRLRTVPESFTMPIELQVGDTRVSLERFAPLGRVEIDLNAPEIIDGINAAVSGAADAQCPTGEHIRNGDFSSWTRTADQPTGSQSLDAGFLTRRIAIASDCTAVVAGGADSGSVGLNGEPTVLVQLAAVDEFTDRVYGQSTPLSAGRVLSGLAGDPGGRYVYALLDGDTVMTLDIGSGLSTFAALADDGANAIVTSADGRTLYVAGSSAAAVVALAADAVRAGGTGLSGAQIALDRPPVDLVATPDGSTLWVLGDDDGRVAVTRIDTARLAVSGSPIPLDQGATRLAVSADGLVVAAVHPGSSTLSIVDMATGSVRRLDVSENNDDAQPAAVAISADGHYAFVPLANRGIVSLVDLTQAAVLRRIEVGPAPSDCAITRDGERVYVADATGSDTTFTALTIGALLPEDWIVTAGTVRPWCVAPTGRVVVVGARPQRALETPTATAGLSQVAAASGGCRYELTCLGLASDDGATVELHWRSAGCAESRVDTVPITPDVPRLVSRLATVPTLLPHRLLVDAPPDATQVELRVQAPAGLVAVVDSVSLHATTSVLPNGDLSLFGNVLDGWLVTPPAAAGFNATVAGGELVLRNGAGVPVTVAQQATVVAGQTYQLTVDATAPTGSPSVDVAWLAAGAPIGSPASVPVTADGSRPLLTSVTAPTSAGTAEVRLVLPAATELHLNRVALDAVVITQMPVTFVAESPGELTLTNWQVAYDADQTPRVPAPPPGGLCRPGRPEPVPGEASDDCCYCATCQSEQPMTDPQPAATTAGTPGTVLTCANCGSSVTLPGVIIGAGPGSGPVVVTPAPGTDVGAVMRPRPVPVRPVPLVAVKGIGRARARALNALGIVGVADLAATAPARLRTLRGITEAAAQSWIDQARTLATGGAVVGQ